jgi:hypothetical protein
LIAKCILTDIRFFTHYKGEHSDETKIH